MPVAQPNQQDLIEALKQRGLLATGGNIRAIPFSDEQGEQNPAADDNARGGEAPSPSAASSVARPQGATPLVKGNTLVDPTTGQPLEGSIADDWWKYLLAGAGIGGGVALADILRGRMKGGSASPNGSGENIPTVEGEVITDPLSALPDNRPIINGEYTDVNAPQLAGPANAVSNDPSAAAALADRNKQITSRNIPRANPVPANDTSVVRGTDAMSDIAPEEVENAKALVQQLIANRVKGNSQRANTGNLTRRAGPPTGPVDKGTEDGLLNTIIRLMRESGASRIIPKAI